MASVRRRHKREITEEEMAAYLQKKVAKKLKLVAGYSNDSNRFGDSNLDEQFVWRKKIERQGVPLSLESEKKRQTERMAEILRVRKKREERAASIAAKVERVPHSYSPQLLHHHCDEDAIDPEEDKASSERKRVAVNEAPCVQEGNFELSAAMEEEGDVVVFGLNDEINIDSQVYWWHDKYRPRKPKYLSRVHTGYEWNKYNRIHYDLDNPPPKFVQGYKFDVFYPDLVYKSKAPTYTIERDGDSAETCIIRFHGGPPYEDIALRIVNGEWEYSRKKGFKCTYEGGILHVYFNFKRFRYRR